VGADEYGLRRAGPAPALQGVDKENTILWFGQRLVPVQLPAPLSIRWELASLAAMGRAMPGSSLSYFGHHSSILPPTQKT